MKVPFAGSRTALTLLRIVCLCLAAWMPLQAGRTIIVGSDRNFPPYEYVDAQGQPAGFLVDLVRASASEAGLDIEIRPGVWSDLRGAFDRGELDVLSGMFYTEERARTIHFSVPHSYPRYAIFRRAKGPDIRTEADLQDRTILAERSDIVFETLRARKLRMTGTPSPREALLDVAAGKADCAIVLKSVGLYYLKQDRVQGVITSGPPLFPQKYCFAIRQDDPELLSRLNEGLFIVKGSGKYAELYEKHFGALEPPDIPFSTVLKRTLVLLLPVVVVLLAVLVWTWSLRRLVRQRTQSLQHELAERKRMGEALLATEARYTRLFQSMTDAYLQVDMSGRIVDFNPALQRMLGYSEAELRGRTYLDLTPEVWHAMQREIVEQQIIPLGSSRLYEKEYRRKDNTVIPVELRSFLLRDEHGQPSGMWGIIRDISERRAAMLESRRLRQLLETVVDTADIWINTLDTEARIVIWNQAAERISGYTKAEVQNNPAIWEWLYPDPAYREEIFRKVSDILGQQATVTDFITRLRDRGGAEHLISWDSRALQDPGGKPTGSLAIGRDVTQSRRAEEALRESERKLASLIANLPGFIYQSANEPGWPMRFLSEGCRSITGYAPGAFLGDRAMRFGDLVLPEYRETLQSKWSKALSEGGVFEDEYPIRSATGEQRWLWERGRGLYDERHRLVAVEGFVTDITERKRAEEAYLQLQEAWSQFVRHSPVYLNLKEVTPTMSRVLMASDNYIDMIGVPGPDMVGRTMEELFPSELAAKFTADDWAVVAQGTILKVDEELNGRSYTSIKFPIQVGDRTLLGGYTIDITDRKRMEEERRQLEAQLQHAQKMESMGSLAGGVAHDMNNVLAAILALAAVEHERAAEGSSIRKNMDTITKACTRAGSLVKGLLGFARQALTEERLLDLNTVVREEVAILERTTLQKVRLLMDLAEDPYPVMGDPAALSHALMNLCVNAVDAMPDGGSLTLRTRNEGTSSVLLEVIDTGSGMPAEVVEKAMDPFFTTKPQGKGTGLGLSIVYGTVKAHRGQIQIWSAPGVGTTVAIRLPACERAGAAAEGTEPLQTEERVLRVLVVDDDDLIRESTGQILEALGHIPTIADGGAEALRLLQEGLATDMVILDLNMPGMSGAEALPKIRALRPGLPVLLATGRPDQQAIELVQSVPLVTLLAKPYSLKDLSAHLR